MAKIKRTDILNKSDIEKYKKQSKQAHTPTPWKIKPISHYQGHNGPLVKVYSGENDQILGTFTHGNISTEEAEANASFIVRACNSHDELLLACKLGLEAINNSNYPDKIAEEVRKAIAKAESK